MTTIEQLPPLDDYNVWADFWRYKIGVNVIPDDTRNKKPLVPWKEWQNNPIPEEMHKQWKEQNAFSKGIAIVPGKVWHRPDRKDLYLIAIDADTKGAIDEFCTINGKTISLQEVAQKFIVEQHKDNLQRAHIYFYSPVPFPKKDADSVIGLEVKGVGEHGVECCANSLHKNGKPYEIIGTTEPLTLTVEQAKELIEHIDQICKKYNLEYLEKHYRNLLDSNAKIHQGERHDSLISIANSLLFRYGGNGKSEQELKNTYLEINNSRCQPPLAENETNQIWNDAVAYYTKKKNEGLEFAKENSWNIETKSSAQTALHIVEEQCSSLFLDQFGTLYAAIKVGQHTETLPLKSARFKNWLCRIYYSYEQDIISTENITNVLNILKARAEFDGPTKNLHLRVASIIEEPYTIYYDLTNKDWQVVKITDNQWTIQYTPILFRRYNNQQPQVYPSKQYPPDIFDRFMNLANVKGEDNKLLLKCYIILLFIPDILKPALMLHGEQGSAKSTLEELIKMLVDPSSIRTLTFPRNINELVQVLMHNYIAYFDNVSIIPEWISDQLCRAVTGSGFSKRELYTDDDDIIYNFKRCIGFNGVNLGATKADLLDRGLIIELERISRERQRRLEAIWAEFNNIKPELLGYIFDILVKVLQVKSNGRIRGEFKGLPRMADFAEIGEIISRCMGNDKDDFIKAYYRNIDLQAEEAIAANIVGNAIISFMEDNKGKWIGTFSQLHMELVEKAASLNIDVHDKSWPKSANRLSRKLNEIKTSLREVGITIDCHKDQKTRLKTVEIRKVSSESSESSESKNQARITSDLSDDTKADRMIVSSGDKVLSNKVPQNRAQNSTPNDTNDTLHTLSGPDLDNLSSDNLEEWYHNELKKIKPLDPSYFAFSGLRCYYCEDFETDSSKDGKRSYETHVKNKHGDDADHPCYPSKADLERLQLKPQRKRWEI